MSRRMSMGKLAFLGATLGLLGVACEPTDLSLTVNTTADLRDADPGDGVCEATVGAGNCSLRAAIDEANAFDGSVGVNVPAGTYTLTRGGIDDSNAGGDLDVRGHVVLVGASGTIIDAGGNDRAFDVRGILKLNLTTVQGGATADDGGAIRVIDGGALTVSGSSLVDNVATGSGGGLAVLDGTATVERSTIAHNTAGRRGGGVHTAPGATTTLTLTTVSTNTVDPLDPDLPVDDDTPLPASVGGGSPQLADGPAGAASDQPPTEVLTTMPAAPVAVTSEPPPSADGLVPVLVQVGGDAPARALARRLDAAPDDEVQVVRTYSHLPVLALEVTPERLAALEADPDVVHVQPDGLSAPLLAQSVPHIGGDVVADLGFDGSNQVVAVIDSGVDADEPMTAGKVLAEACFARGANGAAAGGDCNGQNSSSGPGSGAPCAWLSLGCWHGTHVASTAVGAQRLIGGQPHAGVARGAGLLSVNVASRFVAPNCGTDSSGTAIAECMRIWDSDVLAALNWVIGQSGTFDIAAVNLSLGSGASAAHCDGDVRKPAIDTLRALGTITVAASGNSGQKTGIMTPACISTALSVGATFDDADAVADFSQSAPILDLLAPGVNITAEFPTIPGNPGDYVITADGTSMAAPHVSGAIAALRSAMPDATVTEIEDALVSTGVPVTDTNGVTAPRIDLRAAFAALSSTGVGGGVSNGGATTLVASTVTANSAWLAGGVHDEGNLHLLGTIVGGQAAGSDCRLGPGSTSGGYNLVGDATCALAPSDVVGNPQLGALTANGGFVPTHVPQAGSPARNAIPAGHAPLCDSTYVADARLVGRPQSGACDIGAVET